MSMNHVILDFHNLNNNALDIIDEVDNYHIWLFLDALRHKSLPLPVIKSLFHFPNDHVHFIEMQQSHEQAVSQYISFYLGKIAAMQSESKIFLMTENDGYQPTMNHIRTHYEGIDIVRFEEMPTLLGSIASPTDELKVETSIDPKQNINQLNQHREDVAQSSLIDLPQSTDTTPAKTHRTLNNQAGFNPYAYTLM